MRRVWSHSISVIQYIININGFLFCRDQKLISSVAFHWVDFWLLCRLYPVHEKDKNIVIRLRVEMDSGYKRGKNFISKCRVKHLLCV